MQCELSEFGRELSSYAMEDADLKKRLENRDSKREPKKKAEKRENFRKES